MIVARKSLAYYQRNQMRFYAVKAFFYALIISSIIIIPIMFVNNGYFLYYGDFNVQQIPFYKLAHDSILSGNYKWSYLTDLGSNFIGSYSFYLLGSPFFYLTLLLPSEYVAYAMGPILILKLSCCSLTAYIYLRRYVKDKNYAVIGGLLYAFSGFSIYNIFFFHFHEAMIVLPLLLAALDEYLNTKRKGVVALAVLLCAFVNYYFFVGEVVFAAIYFVVKIVSNSVKINFKEFLILALECIIGLLMSAVIVLPSCLAIISNGRTTDTLMGWDALVYDIPQRYLHILSSFFFPPDLPARPNFTPNSASKWSSIAAFLPLFSMIFVIAYIKQRKNSWLKRLFIVLFVMAFIPLLNSMFQLFNSAYYARWFYMLTLIMILMTIYSLDNIREVNTSSAIIWTVFITLAIALSIGIMPTQQYSNSKIQILKFGLENNKERFWIYVFIAIFGIIITSLILVFLKNKPKLMSKVICIILCIVCVFYSDYLLWEGKSESDHKDEFVTKYALDYGKNITIEDVKDVRNDFYKSLDNIAMYWQVPTIQAFHSIVPSSLINFYNTIGVERTVASRPDISKYGLRSFLSTKYLFSIDEEKKFTNEDNETLMPGYKLIGNENGISEYQNTNYIPMGFMYDKFICEEEFKNLSNDVKHLALLKAMVLTQNQIEKYSDITGFTPGKYKGLTFDENNPINEDNPKYEKFDSITTYFTYDNESFTNDCSDRAKNACDSFQYDNDGFTATITNKGNDNLLFFSIPYDEGWTAFIDDKPVEIEKVNIGFMAVKIDANKTSKIRFKYTTPGLKYGMYISIASVVIFIIYLIIFKGFKAKKKYRKIYKVKNFADIKTEEKIK